MRLLRALILVCGVKRVRERLLERHVLRLREPVLEAGHWHGLGRGYGRRRRRGAREPRLGLPLDAELHRTQHVQLALLALVVAAYTSEERSEVKRTQVAEIANADGGTWTVRVFSTYSEQRGLATRCSQRSHCGERPQGFLACV